MVRIVAIARLIYDAALHEYTPRLVKHYKILLGIFDAHETSETPINASQSFMDLFFDVVSDLTFGKSFDSLTTKQRNPIIGEFLNQQRAIGFMLLNMWLFYFIRCIPLVQSMIKDWLKWYGDALDARKKVCRIILAHFTTKTTRWNLYRLTFTHTCLNRTNGKQMVFMKHS